MNDIAIRVEDLGKKYRLGQTVGYKTLRDGLTNLVSAPFRRRTSMTSVQTAVDSRNQVWALKKVSFEVKRGEAVAIIGSNGAGKSTLLKILSRITTPTTGYAEVNGRVGSLLEIGTGFHPELTGKENIYLNGSILGMKKNEIKRVFDQIVDFAGIEKFLDTPVKRYSSGMNVRLGFAVAAHLEPEILVVDEVLAVGDAAFQKKCMGKMGDIASQGRTVLFVSHNMLAVRNLCPRSILINQGQIEIDGDTSKVLQRYLGTDRETPSRVSWPHDQRPGNRSFKINSITLKSPDSSPCASLEISKGGFVEINFEVIEDGGQANFYLGLYDSWGNCLLDSISNHERNFYGKPLQKGVYVTTCELPGNLLGAGTFSITIVGSRVHWADYFRLENVLSFSAIDDGVLRGDYYGIHLGALRPKLEWNTMYLGE